jgi:ABC-type transport system substrate-binding protein
MTARLYRLVSACLMIAVMSTLLLAQPPGKARKEEEEDAKTPPAATEAKQEAKQPQKQPARQAQPLEWGPFNLTEEAKNATVPDVKKYLEDLTLTADEVVSMAGKVYRTAPIPKKYDAKEGKPLDFTTLEGNRMALQPDQIRDVTYYEQRVLEKTRLYLDRRFDAASISRFQQLRAAEKVLVEALRYHQGLISQGSRDKTSWAGTEAELANRLQSIRIDELRALTADRDYATAEALAQKMFVATPGDRVMLDVIEGLYVKQCDDQFNENNVLQARLILEILRDRYRNPLTAGPPRRIIERLEDIARKKFEAAKKAIVENKRTDALSSLEDAEQAWPTFPGLREFRVKLLGEYAVLRVGVRTLPAVFSPLTAMTDADRMACRLIYEPLVNARSAPSATDGYNTLITETPRRIAKGYEFVIPNHLKWSDGTPVKSDDVQRSFEFVSKPGTPMYDPGVDNDGLYVLNQIDETRFTVTFRAPTLDPLSVLNFPLVPSSRLPRDQSSNAAAAAFAKNPLGTGPYMFGGLDGDEVVFKVNPHYKRPHLPNGPAIKEIRFIRYSDWNVARQALLDGRWQMLLDATSKEMDDVTGNPQAIVFTPTEARAPESTTVAPRLTNPRLYILGFNYRKPVFQKKELREGISMAIDRAGIIATLFRGKVTSNHAVLNGPFPVGSWGYDTASFNGSPYASVQAAGKVRAAGTPPPLTIAVMQEDSHGVAACKMIAADLAKAGITATVTPVPANSLFVDMYKPVPSFDMLYTTWDFTSESLNLRPLLDVTATGGQGANFMSYQIPPNPQDPSLMRYLANGLNNRELENARRQMFSIHKHVMDNAIFVPLYQLDKHVAVHRSLDQYERFHPLFVFDGVEKWILKAGGQ